MKIILYDFFLPDYRIIMKILNAKLIMYNFFHFSDPTTTTTGTFIILTNCRTA